MSQELIDINKLPPPNVLYDGMKRLLDIVTGTLLLLLFAVPMLFVAIAIRCTSSGGAFYRQKRVGKNHRFFYVYKFRTMYSNADQIGPEITSADDARITPLGRRLRNTKIDELPQLINVIKGEMSMVGPRPQVPRFVDKFNPAQREIVLAVRPGITGPTQLQYRDEEQMLAGHSDRERYYIEHLLPTKCLLDVDYVQRRSLLRDAHVLWETVVVLLSGILKRNYNPPPQRYEVIRVEPIRRLDEVDQEKDVNLV